MIAQSPSEQKHNVQILEFFIEITYEIFFSYIKTLKYTKVVDNSNHRQKGSKMWSHELHLNFNSWLFLLFQLSVTWIHASLFTLIRKIKNLPWIRHLLYSKVPDLLLNISYRLYCLFLKHLGKKFLSWFYKETGLENLSLEIVSTGAKTWTQSCLSAIPTPKTCALSTPQLSLTDNISYLHPELCLW